MIMSLSFSQGHWYAGNLNKINELSIDISVNGLDDPLQLGPFLTQALGVFRIVPDIRAFQFAGDLGQTLVLGIVVKDTP